jgi:uncharacterized membrane protein (UPF0127 family)
MKIKLRNRAVEASVAGSFFAKMIGLSFSKKRNMLFTMDEERRWSFWMFGVMYPLKIIFLDASKRVVDIKEARPLSLDPRTWRTYVPKKPSKYIFETPFDLKIRIDDKMDW